MKVYIVYGCFDDGMKPGYVKDMVVYDRSKTSFEKNLYVMSSREFAMEKLRLLELKWDELVARLHDNFSKDELSDEDFKFFGEDALGGIKFDRNPDYEFPSFQFDCDDDGFELDGDL